MNTHLVNTRGHRGSALVTVLLFTFLLAAIVASMLQWALQERRMNMRSGYWMEARNAAEALAEFGTSQIATAFTNTASPATFDPAGTSPLVLPPTSFFAGGNVDTAVYSATHNTGQELIAGTVQKVPDDGSLYFIDPLDPKNKGDTFVGQWVFRRDIQVIARATVVPPTRDKPVTACLTQTITVRGAPLFSHAIFYSNNDLEIFPGPTMNIYGPVHCNGNIFVSSQGSSLTFNGPVSCSGYIFHAWAGADPATHGSGNETLSQSPVNFLKGTSTSGGTITYTTTPMDPSGTATGWKDSTMGADNGVSGIDNLKALVTQVTKDAFLKYASDPNNWNGSLQTSVAPYYPVAFKQIVDSAQDTPDPHVIIDPANGNLPTTDLYYNAKTQVESQKLANKAGLYIQVNVSDPNNPLINIYGPPGSTTTSTPPGNIGPNGGIKLIPPTNMSDGSLTTVAGVTYYKLNTGKQAAEPTTGSGTPPLVTYLPFRVKNVVVTKSGSTYTTTTKILDAKGNPVALDSYTTAGTVTTAGSGTVGTTNTLYSNSTVTGSSYGYGMYDQRRGTTGGANLTNSTSFVAGLAAGDPGATDLVQIDMKALNAAVDSMAAGTSGVLDPKNSIKNLDGTIWGPPRGSNTSPDWNGGVYVEVKTSVSPTTTPYVPADYPAALANQTTSVRLVDGTVSSGSSLMPNYGDGGLGLTVATNAPVYILGNFNADGNASTGDATTPDDGHTGAAGSSYSESPVCVAGDAVTLLSKNWQDSASLKNNNTADDTEYATALLVGLVPTGNVNADSQYANSGGAHNLPRFLENWSGQTATLRGSLATLFNCKVAKQSWSTQYYSPPNRNWGFDQILKNGHYPPITPRVIDTKRILFTTLSQDAYNTIRHNMWPSEF